MTQNQYGIVVTAEDKASEAINRVRASVDRLDGTFGRIEKSGIRVHNAFGKFNAVLQGMGLGVGIGSFYALERAIGRVIGIIPDLLGKGNDWLSLIDDISDSTGMSAASSSKWAYVAQVTQGSTEGLVRGLQVLNRMLVTQPEKFEKYGIQVRGVRGELLGAEQVLENVRRRLQEVGNSAEASALGQKVLGRSFRDLMDFVMLADPALAKMAADARASGLIVSDAMVAAVENAQRARRTMDMAFTGIGSMVTSAVSPALTSMFNGITQAIQSNLPQIAGFVIKVIALFANLVATLVGFQIQLGAVTGAVTQNALSFGQWREQMGLADAMSQKASRGTDAFTQSIQRQIGAIDRQLKVMDRADQAADARRRLQQAQGDLADAERALGDTRAAGYLSSEMSALEREQALQQHVADVASAKQRVQDARDAVAKTKGDRQHQLARQRLQDERQMLQDQLAAHQQMLSGVVKANGLSITTLKGMYGAYLRGFKQQMREQAKTLGPDFLGDLTKSLQEGLGTGKDIAGAIQDALLGKETKRSVFGIDITSRGGGLFDKLAELAKKIGELVDWLNVNGGPFRAATDLGGAIDTGAKALNPNDPGHDKAVQDALKGGGDFLSRPWEWLQDIFGGILPKRKPEGTGASTLSPGSVTSNPAVAGEWGPTAVIPGTTDPMSIALRRLSDTMGLGQDQMIDQLGAVGVNTAVLPNGQLGVVLPDGQKVSIKDWLAQQTLPVGNSGFANIGRLFNWNAGDLGVTSPKLGRVDFWAAGRLGVEATGTVAATNPFFSGIGSIFDWSAGKLGVQGTVGVANNPLLIATNGGNTVNVEGTGGSGTIDGAKRIGISATFTGAMRTIGAPGTAGQLRAMARGGVGVTGGATNVLMGEAGNEAYAILRNPREGSLNTGGGGFTDTQVDRIIRAIREARTLQLDGGATRALFRGDPVTTTTRAPTGT